MNLERRLVVGKNIQWLPFGIGLIIARDMSARDMPNIYNGLPDESIEHYLLRTGGYLFYQIGTLITAGAFLYHIS